MSTPQYTPDDFYREYAIAMLTWQQVESALFNLFYRLFEHGNLKQAGAAYYSLDSFGAKLRLVDATASVVLHDAHLKLWNELNKDLRAASADRNVLAHMPAVVKINHDQSLSLVLGRPIHVPPSLVRKRKTTYDAGECERLSHHFKTLVIRLEKFSNAHAWANVRSRLTSK